MAICPPSPKFQKNDHVFVIENGEIKEYKVVDVILWDTFRKAKAGYNGQGQWRYCLYDLSNGEAHDMLRPETWRLQMLMGKEKEPLQNLLDSIQRTQDRIKNETEKNP